MSNMMKLVNAAAGQVVGDVIFHRTSNKTILAFDPSTGVELANIDFTNKGGATGGAFAGCTGFTGTISNVGQGATGETGGSGGDWGQNGFNTTDSGDGGEAGDAIVKSSGVTITGIINSNTIKGSY